MTENTVTISKVEYHLLVSDQKMLYALQSAGVDNWSGYDYALGLLANDGD